MTGLSPEVVDRYIENRRWLGSREAAIILERMVAPLIAAEQRKMIRVISRLPVFLRVQAITQFVIGEIFLAAQEKAA